MDETRAAEAMQLLAAKEEGRPSAWAIWCVLPEYHADMRAILADRRPPNPFWPAVDYTPVFFGYLRVIGELRLQAQATHEPPASRAVEILEGYGTRPGVSSMVVGRLARWLRHDLGLSQKAGEDS